MNKRTMCLVAEQVGELAMGAAISIILDKTVMPKCTTAEKVLVQLGAMPCGWMLGRAWGKSFLKWCDEMFDTEFREEVDKM